MLRILMIVQAAAALFLLSLVSSMAQGVNSYAPTSFMSGSFVVGTAPTDAVCLEGNAVALRVLTIYIGGQSAAAADGKVFIVKRSSLNTGGTSTTATGAVSADSQDSTPAGVLRLYTVNPTALGVAAGTVATAEFGTNTATSVPAPALIDFRGGKLLTVRTGSEAVCLNFNGAATFAGATLDVTFVLQGF